MKYIAKLKNDELISITRGLVKEERRITLEVLRYLCEIERRKLFLERGFPSLFEMSVAEFGYSSGAAQRRIDSMRLLKDVPEMVEKVASGELNLTSLSQVQSFLRFEKKTEARVYSKQEKRQMLESMTGKSTREVARELVKLNPQFVRRESVQVIGEGRVRLTLSLKEETDEKLQKLKAIFSHSNPGMTYEELIDRMAEIALDKYDPIRKAERAELRSQKNEAKTECASNEQNDSFPDEPLPAPEVDQKVLKRSRYISAPERWKVWLRKADRCEFVDPATGRKCDSRHFLQLDHFIPYSVGGENCAQNLRLLCGAHNRARASDL